jgi:hypothetical protein
MSPLSEDGAIYRIPSRRAYGFVGREDILDLIHKRLSSVPSP